MAKKYLSRQPSVNIAKVTRLPGKTSSVATSTDPGEIQNLLNQAQLISTDGACVMMAFTVEEDLGFDTFQSFLGEKMITYDVNAFVRFFSIEKQEYIDQEFPMLGYLIVSRDSLCHE